MFETSNSFLFFDYFRVPYRVARVPDALVAGLSDRHPLRSCGWLRPLERAGASRVLYWPLADRRVALDGMSPAGAYRLGALHVWASVAPDGLAGDLLRQLDGSWRREAAVTDAEGRRVGSVWRDAEGSIFLPFSPAEVIRSFWTEGYQLMTRSALPRNLSALARRAYYGLRPALPRPVQIGMRRAFTRLQERAEFPRWPIEPSLHDFYAWLFALVAEVAGRPVPWISCWPDGHSWALVLTHDVETEAGYRNLETVRALELAAGVRSSWNFVARRYGVEDALVAELTREGFEVGVHGLYHDGLDLDSAARLAERLPGMHEARDRWGAVGFRAPAMHRHWSWMADLGFDYDSSYPDTDPYEPQPGGCCSWLPYPNGNTIELPVTLPQDHTLFTILRHKDERLWTEKASFLRERGGMALIITHPDYMADGGAELAAYRRFVASFAEDGGAWKPLPREVAAWWRRRASSRIDQVRGRWTVVGPAAREARLAFATAHGEPV